MWVFPLRGIGAGPLGSPAYPPGFWLQEPIDLLSRCKAKIV